MWAPPPAGKGMTGRNPTLHVVTVFLKKLIYLEANYFINIVVDFLDIKIIVFKSLGY